MRSWGSPFRLSWLTCGAQGATGPCTLSVGIKGTSLGFWETWSSGPHACTASTLLTEPSRQPIKIVLKGRNDY
ncbi:hypothetical protein I79_023276 [Cricetulus griseus]|uniref:Secreted protein n=1 Tax=Cricetulus griseus TaxID=10029 RepID=G3IHI6_CRIGR|nr:hypothetical protein I79_023276 [Cricetulus griseus]